MLEKEDMEVNENIGNYYEALSAFDRKAMVAEEFYNRKKLGIKTLTDEALESLRTTKGPEKRTD